MANTKLISLVDERIAELKQILINLQNGIGADGKPIAKATMSTQRYHKLRDQNVLKLVKELLEHIPEDIKLKNIETFNQLVEPQNIRSSISVKEGDDLIALLSANADVKDVYNKIMKAAASADLKLVNNKFVK